MAQSEVGQLIAQSVAEERGTKDCPFQGREQVLQERRVVGGKSQASLHSTVNQACEDYLPQIPGECDG